MALMTPRTRLRLAWGALALLAVAAGIDAWRWQDKQRDNALIGAGVVDRPGPIERAELRFAHAAELARRGEREAAIDAYRALQDDSALGRSARYNAANQLLLQAVVLRGSALPGQALPLIELAKASYREVLRQDPGHWDARYNLERAQRLQPDPDDAEPEAAGPPENAERAATTIRGVSRGLP
jgi:mxaK protein